MGLAKTAPVLAFGCLTCTVLACVHNGGMRAYGTDARSVPNINLAEPNTTRPVVAGAAIAPAELHPGDNAAIHILIRIAPGWHIYPPHHDGVEAPTRLSLELPEYVRPTEDWSMPARTAEPDAVYEGTVHVSRPVRLSASAPLGRGGVIGNVSFQACNASVCRPPQSITFEIPLIVVEPAS